MRAEKWVVDYAAIGEPDRRGAQVQIYDDMRSDVSRFPKHAAIIARFLEVERESGLGLQGPLGTASQGSGDSRTHGEGSEVDVLRDAIAEDIDHNGLGRRSVSQTLGLFFEEEGHDHSHLCGFTSDLLRRALLVFPQDAPSEHRWAATRRHAQWVAEFLEKYPYPLSWVPRAIAAIACPAVDFDWMAAYEDRHGGDDSQSRVGRPWA